jgi:hypothetical protein
MGGEGEQAQPGIFAGPLFDGQGGNGIFAINDHDDFDFTQRLP